METDQIVQELEDFILDNEISEYSDALILIKSNFDPLYRRVFKQYASHFRYLVNSLRYRGAYYDCPPIVTCDKGISSEFEKNA